MPGLQEMLSHAPGWFAAYVVASYVATLAFIICFGPFPRPFNNLIKWCFYLAPLAFPFFVVGLASFVIFMLGAAVSDLVNSLCDSD